MNLFLSNEYNYIRKPQQQRKQLVPDALEIGLFCSFGKSGDTLLEEADFVNLRLHSAEKLRDRRDWCERMHQIVFSHLEWLACVDVNKIVDDVNKSTVCIYCNWRKGYYHHGISNLNGELVLGI